MMRSQDQRHRLGPIWDHTSCVDANPEHENNDYQRRATLLDLRQRQTTRPGGQVRRVLPRVEGSWVTPVRRVRGQAVGWPRCPCSRLGRDRWLRESEAFEPGSSVEDTVFGDERQAEPDRCCGDPPVPVVDFIGECVPDLAALVA